MSELLAWDLREVVQSVWTVMLGFEVFDALDALPAPSEPTWCGCVRVGGAWNGLVKLSIGEALTRRAAAAMFGAPPESLSHEDLTDALGEMANMTGGSVKALLPGPSRLSLPLVAIHEQPWRVSARGSLLREVAFQSGGSQLHVQVIEARRPTWLDWDGLWGASTRASEPSD
jgi:chemotaxis protein CheX